MTLTLDWAAADLDGSNTVTDGTYEIGFTISTPDNVNGKSWKFGEFPGDSKAPKSANVFEPTELNVAFDTPVKHLCFEIYDVDAGKGWDDKVTVIALDKDGNEVPVTFGSVESYQTVDGNTVEAEGNDRGSIEGPGGRDSITVSVEGPIVSLTIIHDNGEDFYRSGTIGLGDVSFQSALDGIVEGTDDGELIDEDYEGDPEGDKVDSDDNVLVGKGPDDDIIEAGGGDDTIKAGDGDDDVEGGEGNDVIEGGDGDDTIYGGEKGGGAGDLHDEPVDGSTPDADPENDRDSIDGGDGDDVIFGGDDKDTLSGGAGDDFIDGGIDDDLITGGEGSDTLLGGDDRDTFTGITDGDSIVGGEGGQDEDTLDLTGSGPARVIYTGGDPASESGTVEFLGDDGAVTGTATFEEIENIVGALDGIVEGTDGGDLIDYNYTGDPEGDRVDHEDNIFPDRAENDDIIEAGAGDDTIFAGEGDDLAYGGEGDDEIAGGVGDDTLLGESGDDTLYGGNDDGDDSLDGGEGDDLLVGGEGDDTLEGGSGMDSLFGDEGDDVLDGGEGDDTMDAGDGDDTVMGGAGDDSATGGVGDDVIEGNEGEDSLSGGEGDDYIDGGDDDDHVSGGLGDDTVLGGAGDDSVTGGSGDDVLDGGDGVDTITGGSGSDTVAGGDGDDIINAGIGGLPDRGYGTVIPADPLPDDDRDYVDGGDGDDFITTGDDDDTILGGAGDDTIDAGLDDDDIDAGDGADSVIGGEGADTIEGGDGDDTLWGGLGTNAEDPLNVRDDGTSAFGPELDDTNGRDLIDGGDGDDLIYGEDDADTLLGGDGNDTIDGGIDDDSIEGGAGDDSLIGGQGDDTILGGDGMDTFTGDTGSDSLLGGADQDLFVVGSQEGGIGDTILGGDSGVDWDTLDLRGTGPFRIVDRVVDSDGNGFDGRVEYLDGPKGSVIGTTTFENIEEVIPCFTPGAMIATPRGERLVEELTVGDEVLTRDNGVQRIRWVGHKMVNQTMLAAVPQYRPVLIRKGALGNGLPERDMMVSPNHRMLVADDRNALYFDEREVLVAAKHLIDGQGITRAKVTQATYVHVMFDRHEVILSDGSWTESFQPGDYSLRGIDHGQREEILAIFPELSTAQGRGDYAAARKSLKKHEALLLAK